MVKRLVFNLKRCIYKPEVNARFRNLMLSQFLSADEIEMRQEQARQDIVRFAFQNVNFYRKFYGDVGFQLGDIGKEGWFQGLPVLTKAHLRTSFDEIVHQPSRQFLATSTTGGSTGTPTKSGYDGRITEEIYPWRLQEWFGVHPWDHHAYIWRNSRTSLIARVKNAVLWWPTRHLKLDASLLSEQSILEFLHEYNRLRPSLLQGYVGAVTQVAQFVLDRRLDVWSPKFVWVTSAPLPPLQRDLIKRAFRAPVCDQYGSCEIRWIAQQCPEERGLHANVEHVNVEFVGADDKPVAVGEYGRTLLTNLEDRVFPMIRYENGDRGRWLKEKCPCGRTLPLIDSVKGRESESFVLPSGRMVNGEYLTTIFDATPDIASGFRIIQHKDLSISVQCVPVAGCENKVKSVVAAFAGKIGNEVRVTCEFVTEIPHDRGKLRFVVREK